jgi:Uma2 family endonuclease
MRLEMSTEILSRYEIVSRMPPDTIVMFHGVSWEEYEELLQRLDETAGLRISYDDGTLQVMTISSIHENYIRFIEKLMGVLQVRLRVEIRSFGSATMKNKRRKKANEPDACFYVQSASKIGNRMDLDFEIDPPPDIVVEVDIHHDTRFKNSIYAALRIPEIWRFDGNVLTIHVLTGDEYLEVPASAALPMLTSSVLTGFLTRFPREGELATILAFEAWLHSIS